jgi:serine/threonine protein kinase
VVVARSPSAESALLAPNFGFAPERLGFEAEPTSLNMVCRICEEAVPVSDIDDHQRMCAIEQAQKMASLHHPPAADQPASVPPKKLQSLKSLLTRVRARRGKRASSPTENDADGRQREEIVSIDLFDVLKPLSKGGFGRVYLAKKRATGDVYALKVMKKEDLISGQMMDNVIVERDIMASTSNPFVVELMYAFDDPSYLYLVMEFMVGGDCATLLKAFQIFDEEMSRAYLAETVLALEYLHSLGIIHRDLKPDNLLLTETGHIKLTDFGLSGIGGQHQHRRRETHRGTPKKVPDLLNPTVRKRLDLSRGAAEKWNHGRLTGTPDYIAPEVIRQQSQDDGRRSPTTAPLDQTPDNRGGTSRYLKNVIGPPIDWWSLGVIAFEFLTGLPPFMDSQVDAVFENILGCEVPWPDIPEEMSASAAGVIKELLEPDLNQRLQGKGARAHSFFAGVDWNNLHNEDRSHVFIPKPDDREDTGYFDEDRMATMLNTKPSFARPELPAEAERGKRQESNSQPSPASSSSSIEPARFAFTNTKSLMKKNMEAAFQSSTNDSDLQEALEKVDRFAETTLSAHSQLGGSTMDSPAPQRPPRMGGREARTRRRSGSTAPSASDTTKAMKITGMSENHAERQLKLSSSLFKEMLSRTKFSSDTSDSELSPRGHSPRGRVESRKQRGKRGSSRDSSGSRGKSRSSSRRQGATKDATPIPAVDAVKFKVSRMDAEELRETVSSMLDRYPWMLGATADILYKSKQKPLTCAACQRTFTPDRNFMGACARHAGVLRKLETDNGNVVLQYSCCDKTWLQSKGCQMGFHEEKNANTEEEKRTGKPGQKFLNKNLRTHSAPTAARGRRGSIDSSMISSGEDKPRHKKGKNRMVLRRGSETNLGLVQTTSEPNDMPNTVAQDESKASRRKSQRGGRKSDVRASVSDLESSGASSDDSTR